MIVFQASEIRQLYLEIIATVRKTMSQIHVG